MTELPLLLVPPQAALDAALSAMSRIQNPRSALVREMYDQTSAHPFVWLLQAHRTAKAAELLWQPIGEFWARLKNAAPADPVHRQVPERLSAVPAFLMLAGFSAEAALKALLLQRDLASARAGKMPQWPKAANRHDLCKMTCLLNIPTSVEEAAVLVNMTDAIQWFGRYPVPVEFESEYPQVNGAGDGRLRGFSASDRDMWRSFLDRCFEIARATQDAAAR